jgi:phosphate butyryltransferase
MLHELNKISDLKELALKNKPKRLVLAAAGDEHSIDAVMDAYKMGVIEPVLVGRKEEIYRLASDCNKLDQLEIYDISNDKEIVKKAVQLLVAGEADIMMKGNVTTATLLKGVLNKEYGMQHKSFMSHFAIFELKNYHKLLAITDVALNILPTLDHKVHIVENAVNFIRKIGIEQPKVAALSAIEMVNEKMPSTLDAALLSIMQRRGQIKNCLIDGPLAFDNAISLESKKQKKLGGEVAGNADILLVPNVESGNILYKSLVAFAGAKVAGIVLGADFPIVLTSRADSEETKLNSILLAAASVNKL